MLQDEVFHTSEGNRWFERNRDALHSGVKVDWPMRVLEMLDDFQPQRILEVGCSDGYRLAALQEMLGADVVCAGVDASADACAAGMRRFPELDLCHGLMASIPFEDAFDLVIVNFVLHWVDRAALAKSIAGVDSVVADGGVLIVGDFLPEGQQRRRYHHLPDEDVWTYKQDYAAAFEGLGTYREVVRVVFDHDASDRRVGAAASESRAFCAALVKSLEGYYPEARP